MNPRLLTPAIFLVSFSAAFGLMGWHAGLWHPATPTTAALTLTPAAALSGPPMDAATTAPPPDAAPEDAPPAVVSPEAQTQESEGFLDARDRAAEHGARSH